MITVFHGDDIALSRNAYLETRTNASDTVSFDGASLTLTDLTQALSGNDLFGTSKHIFIEELFSKRKNSKELDEIILLVSHSSSPITLWESKELTTKQISNFKGGAIKVFKIPSTIFALLDGVKAGNGKNLISLFHKTLEDKDAEFVLFMLQRHIRMLLALKNTEGKNISEVARMAPWQMGKLKKQTDGFSTDLLISLHSQLYEVDLGQKTGGLTQPISDTIDFLLLSI